MCYMAPNVHQTQPPMYDMSRNIYVLRASSLYWFILLRSTAIVAPTSLMQFCVEECQDRFMLTIISSSLYHRFIILYYSTHILPL